jgi:predicted MPP superfamily phosphohydrolase
MSRAAQFSFFLLVTAGILGVGSSVVYSALALAFNITNATQLLFLAVCLGVLSASFIAATVLGNWYYNFFTRTYYLIAAVWMGFFFYLFLASIVYGIGVAIFPAFAGAGVTLFLLTLGISAYGVAHAHRIVVTQVSVTLPNLPAVWEGRTAVWISDLHLGQIHGPALARKVVAHIEALAPDIVFVGGDLYDGTGAPDVIELTVPLQHLTAPLGVYFVTGNHEEYGNQERFLMAVKAAGMRILQDEMVVIDGLQLIGVDYKHASDPARFKEILKNVSINTAAPSILLKHVPSHVDIAEAAGVSLQISGHTHKAQMWPLEYVAQLSFPGVVYGLNKLKSMQVFTSSGVGTWGPPMRVGSSSEIVLLTFK